MLSDDEFLEEMKERFPEEVDEAYEYWVVNLRRHTNINHVNSFNGAQSESWKYLIARELQRRMPEKEQRLELVILVGPYLME